jgi:hypothetical protein
VKANEDIAELLQKSLSLDEPTSTAQRVPIASSNDADENTMLVGSSDSSVEGYPIYYQFNLKIVLKTTLRNARYEVIQPPVADLIPRPRVSRGQPLNEMEWQTYFDEEGRIENSQEIRNKIFRGVTEIECQTICNWK